ncbi:MAG: hypothetical protein IJ797_05325 [Selenomonadaceae bacterium]|nr:hypothetical protein [Selenomonadaceae bacterium]
MYYSKQHKSRKRIDSFYKMSTCASLALLILAVPLSFILPVSASFENGLLENLQIVVILFGSCYNLFLAARTFDRQIKYFHLWCAALLVFLVFRELSWGRVFYQIDMEDSGPVFISMADYAWRTEVHIIIVVYLLLLLMFMLLNLPLRRMLRCRIPYNVIFLMSLAVLFSYIGDHGILFGKLQGQILEETGELVFYMLIPALCIHYHREL